MSNEGPILTATNQLDYASFQTKSSGDELAYSVLLRVLRYLFMCWIVLEVMQLLRASYMSLRSPGDMTGWDVITLICQCFQLYFSVRCLKSLKSYQPAMANLFYAAVACLVAHNLILALQTQIALSPYTWPQFGGIVALTIIGCISYSFFALMLPLMYRRETRGWFTILYSCTLWMLAATIVYGNPSLIIKLFQDPTSIGTRDLKTFSVGAFLGLLALILLRKEFNRQAVLVVAGWMAIYFVIELVEGLKYFMQGGINDFVPTLMYVLSTLVRVAGMLPLWLLAWFAMRFDKMQRIEIAGGDR